MDLNCSLPVIFYTSALMVVSFINYISILDCLRKCIQAVYALSWFQDGEILLCLKIYGHVPQSRIGLYLILCYDIESREKNALIWCCWADASCPDNPIIVINCLHCIRVSGWNWGEIYTHIIHQFRCVKGHHIPTLEMKEVQLHGDRQPVRKDKSLESDSHCSQYRKWTYLS